MKGIYWNQDSTGIRMIDAILYSKGQFSTKSDNTADWSGGLSESGKQVTCSNFQYMYGMCRADGTNTITNIVYG